MAFNYVPINQRSEFQSPSRRGLLFARTHHYRREARKQLPMANVENQICLRSAQQRYMDGLTHMDERRLRVCAHMHMYGRIQLFAALTKTLRTHERETTVHTV